MGLSYSGKLKPLCHVPTAPPPPAQENRRENSFQLLETEQISQMQSLEMCQYSRLSLLI